ncbi:contractile injection system protein, VgrG/Pvc8 family [Paenibacillus sp. EZ-K15]|uniref:contractile injection system protein, VgrG/Pvc8 family n=1 Tax=Paenibacillus sp. EZ-K15 TaxID=2044275 RepID=UPI000BFA5C7E|nr:contractile injection system protein, VgrG/Pvc8 family [Paenibacillus sp. EZ-K15]
MIGFENIRVTSPYRLKIVKDIQIEWKPNEHGRLFIRGLVDDQDQVNAVLKASTDDQVQAFDGETKIFSGLIANVQTKHHNGIYSIEIEAVSGSSRLDAQKRRRSFQNKNMTYGELVKSVLKAYAGYDVIQLVGENDSIGEPIIQYDETDWEFLKRMASHFQSVVFSDIYEAKPRMYIGVPTRNSIQLPDDLPYTASKDLLAYQNARSGSASVHHTDFFTYEIQSGTRYAIGDEVLFRDKPMVISEMKAAMDKGQLIYNYRLSRRDGIRQNRIHNQKLIGISMNGKVLDVKGQQIKLHLEIDQEQSPASAYWFPFAPPTGSAMYSMPQKGTNASLYFPDDAGSKAKVIGCVRTNGEDCSKTGDPNNRYFGTEHGSELEITPTAINVVSGSKEPLMISFDDAAGVILTSHRKLTMNAGEDISLYTPKRVVFRTPNMILAKKLSKLSGFTVESEYHILGSKVKLDGADRTSYPKYNDEIETYTPPPPPKEEESGGWGFWDKVCAAVAVVVVVALVVTATVVTGGVAGAVLMGAAFGAVGAVGATFANDLARGEWSSGETYLRSALTGGIVGAVTGGIFGPVGGAASTTLLPATTSQVASGFTAMLASGFASGYTDYTLTELINGRRPTFTGAVTVGTQSAMFSGFLIGLRPVKNALQDLFTKGIKPKTSTNSPQPHIDELKVNNKQEPDVEGAPKKGREGTDEDFVTYRRVQGDGSKDILLIDEKGNIHINAKWKKSQLNVSTGKDHAQYFHNKRGEDSYIVEFDVPKWLDDFIAENAIPQGNYTKNPLNQGGAAPKIVDRTVFQKHGFEGVAYEIPAPIKDWLIEYAVNAKTVP